MPISSLRLFRKELLDFDSSVSKANNNNVILKLNLGYFDATLPLKSY